MALGMCSDFIYLAHGDLNIWSLTSFKAIHKEMGLLRARQQGHSVESVHESMTRLRKRFPKAGAREMVNLLFHELGMSVSRYVITHYLLHGFCAYTLQRNVVVLWFRINEPELVRERRAGRLKRRRFWAAGPNDILAVDQHDKWKRFGLALHTGIDPFSGRIHWLKVWWTNNNPKLILAYYLGFVDEKKCE